MCLFQPQLLLFQLQCCGVQNYTDWIGTQWFISNHTLPLSCCKQAFKNCTGQLSEKHLFNTQVRAFRVCLSVIEVVGNENLNCMNQLLTMLVWGVFLALLAVFTYLTLEYMSPVSYTKFLSLHICGDSQSSKPWLSQKGLFFQEATGFLF